MLKEIGHSAEKNLRPQAKINTIFRQGRRKLFMVGAGVKTAATTVERRQKNLKNSG